MDLTKSVKNMFGPLEPEQMEEVLAAYMSLMSHERKEGEDTVEINIDVVQQMAILASQSLAAQLVRRYK